MARSSTSTLPPNGGLAPNLPLHGPREPVLVEPEDDVASPPATGSLLLVSQDRIVGRAWAQFYPVWDRRLL
jgi:hypothetical protein